MLYSQAWNHLAVLYPWVSSCKGGCTDVARVLTCSGERALPKCHAPLAPTTSRCWIRHTVWVAHRSHPWQVTAFSNRWVSSSSAFLWSTVVCAASQILPQSTGDYRLLQVCTYAYTHMLQAHRCLHSCFACLLLERPTHPFFCSFVSSHTNSPSCDSGLHI